MRGILTAAFSVCMFSIVAVGQDGNWQLNGNAGSNPAIHFIGTTDNNPLIFKVNGAERLRLTPDGSWIQNSDKNIKFSVNHYASGWLQMNTVSLYYPASPVGSGFRISVNDDLKTQFFYNAGAFSFGSTLDGLVGNVDILSRQGDVYLSTQAFLSNGLVVKHNTGFVGIGLNAPKEKLDVNGNIYTNGRVLIGTDGLSAGTHSLAVNGSALFTKAVVKLNTAWPDYVFHPDYPKPSIDFLEQFIKKNGHLPEVPTAAEVEANGIDLGETQAVLLKKIEELTLILIELSKELEQLKTTVNQP